MNKGKQKKRVGRSWHSKLRNKTEREAAKQLPAHKLKSFLAASPKDLGASATAKMSAEANVPP